MQNKEELIVTDQYGRTINIVIKSGYRWIINCYGDNYENVTQCEVYVDNLCVGRSRIVKYFLDEHNQVFAYRCVLTNTLKHTNLNKETRTLVWKEFKRWMDRPF